MLRLDVPDILAPAFDQPESAPSRLLLICTTPRTASWTLCRHMAAQGWGIPAEYLGPGVMEGFRARLPGMAQGPQAYGQWLERHRNLNGIFTTKIMMSQLAAFRSAHEDIFTRLRADVVFLRRRDFAGQIVSFAAMLLTGRYSFSDDTGASIPRIREPDGQVIRRLAVSLIAEEKGWKAFFARRGLTPLHVESEDLTHAPVAVMERASRAFDLPFDEAMAQSSARAEAGGKYDTDGDLKRQMKASFGSLLAELEELRVRELGG